MSEDDAIDVHHIIEHWHVSAPSPNEMHRTLRLLSKRSQKQWSKSQLLKIYRDYLSSSKVDGNKALLSVLKSKPIRTLSGVAPVTVLTKPFPCPGQCIFCPNDVRMPKSYLADEPGAQRAERNWFDPYLQTYNRLEALTAIGHDVDKVEIIVLGGTWSFYPESYQIWFIAECFRALNDFASKYDNRLQRERLYAESVEVLASHGKPRITNDPIVNEDALATLSVQGSVMKVGAYNRIIETHYSSPEREAGFSRWQQATWSELFSQHLVNEHSVIKCVGLVLETRPDSISKREVIRLRKLGATKVQIGVQSLSDEVLKKNRRGHGVKATEEAFILLRSAGFKIHAHWMANLYGSSVKQDIIDYANLFTPPFCPDELKLYPCSLIDSAELMQYYKSKKWKPYSAQELSKVLGEALLATPYYCRLTRIIRDIPSHYIVKGNKKTNFRQIVEQQLGNKQHQMQDIRAREIRQTVVDGSSLKLIVRKYKTSNSTELFLEWNQPSDEHEIGDIVGFLRLSFPSVPSFIQEINDAAIIREVHVYGQLARLGEAGSAQHLGLGAKLIYEAERLSVAAGYNRLAVISAIGTKEYYRKQGFTDGELYQSKQLKAGGSV